MALEICWTASKTGVAGKATISVENRKGIRTGAPAEVREKSLNRSLSRSSTRRFSIKLTGPPAVWEAHRRNQAQSLLRKTAISVLCSIRSNEAVARIAEDTFSVMTVASDQADVVLSTGAALRDSSISLENVDCSRFRALFEVIKSAQSTVSRVSQLGTAMTTHQSSQEV